MHFRDRNEANKNRIVQLAITSVPLCCCNGRLMQWAATKQAFHCIPVNRLSRWASPFGATSPCFMMCSLGVFVAAGIWRTFIQDHLDIRSEQVLNLYTAFRRQHVMAAVDV